MNIPQETLVEKNQYIEIDKYWKRFSDGDWIIKKYTDEDPSGDYFSGKFFYNERKDCGLRELINRYADYEKTKRSALRITVVRPPNGFGANPSRGLTAGERIAISYGVEMFNKKLPAEGISIQVSPMEKGIFWGLDVADNGENIVAIVSIPTYTPITIRLNGVRRINKSENVLSQLAIERIYMVDDKGNETTLFSMI